MMMRTHSRSGLVLTCLLCSSVFCVSFIVLSTVFILWAPTCVITWHKELSLNVKALYPYIAVILDDRETGALVRAVINVLEHIPNDWNVQIITPYQNWAFYKNSSLSQFIRNDRVILTPLDVQRNSFSGSHFANLVLTSAAFWRQVQGDKVLLFQTDSTLCSNSAYNLTYFLKYDFIGAPWKSGGCCNGGLSIRDRTKIIHILESGQGRFALGDINEDGWFVQNLLRFQGRVAPNHVARKFAVETIYEPRPFAVHNPQLSRIGPVNMARLCSECPETKTISSYCTA